MLPGKIGPARKLTMLIDEIKGKDDTAACEISQTAVGHSNNTDKTTDTPAAPAAPATPKSHSTPMHRVTSEGDNHINRPISTYLPTYSTIIQEQIRKEGKLGVLFNKFIEETAYHLLAVGGMDSKDTYDEFGAFMCQKFPCLVHSEGKRNWSYFNSKVSQKVRNIRWKWNKRSERPEKSNAAKRNRTHLQLFDLDDATNMDFLEARELMKEELQKPLKDQDKALILKAQRCSYKQRRQFISEQGDGKISAIIKEFPILGVAKYIEKEFGLLKPTLDQQDVLMERWTDLTMTLDKMFQINKDAEEENEEEEALLLLLKSEEKLRVQRTGKSKTVPVITVVDCKDASLETSSKEAPRLVVIRSEGRLSGAYICGDGLKIEVEKDIRAAILTLLKAYYVWDLSYPKNYQLLGFLQTRILKDTAPFHKSGCYMSFTRLFEENSRY